ncbi:hypothetical protein Vadar_025869 [Vaccinium darrowii]|uniref:Uncharacterized protein n=1 Tax=Vaccinium darrowii TaxID=229202 RepID=A0ACB7YQ22_9ERIC|nr:hypothetical protein Vadar_025869 [Vaccinium darrowii]
MGISNAIKLLLLLVLFGITTALAIEFASSPDSNDETPSRNVSSQEGERSLFERMLRGRRHRGRRPRGRRGPRQPRPLPRVGRPRVGRRRARRAPVIVAQDGSGNFRTIREALDASRRRKGLGRFVIHIKAGVYREILVVDVRMKNIKFIGDGIGRTIITGSNFNIDKVRGTWESATVLVEGEGFVARDLTFQNTNGLAQAPAITITAPTSAFYRVGFEGYQDTVYVKQGKQFFKECDVYGTVDFICGNGASIFQNSKIIARKPLNGGNTITISASDRNQPNDPTGLVFQNCLLTATPDLRAVLFGPDLAASSRLHIYLGRPWQAFSRTIFMTCDFDLPIHAEGWLEWEKRRDGGPNVYYREFSNKGLGSGTGGRVRWAGYRVMTDRNEANQFTVANFIQEFPKTLRACLFISDEDCRTWIEKEDQKSFLSKSFKENDDMAKYVDVSQIEVNAFRDALLNDLQNSFKFDIDSLSNCDSLVGESIDEIDSFEDNAIARQLDLIRRKSDVYPMVDNTMEETNCLGVVGVALAIEFASSPDSNDETPRRNVSSPEGGRSLLQRMLRGRRPRGPRRPRPLPRVGRPRAGRRRGRRAPVVVAQDGSGNFRTIKEALDASLRRKGVGRFVIHIKAGVYREALVVDDLTFQNTYRHQPAPAVTIEAPRSAFYRVGFDGYQDTVYVISGQQFFKECDVYGTVDFICGNGAAIFQNSNIIARKSFTGHQITITASARNWSNELTGLIFQNCRIMATPDLRAVFGLTQIYLGRPWKPFSRTIFVNCDIDLPIHPEGWLAWDGAPATELTGPNVYYREFGNRGMGSWTGGRVRWAGYRPMMDRNEANQFTVTNFIQGLTWLPRTGVPFFAGL